MKIKLLTATAKLPTKGTPGAACWDAYADEDAYVPPGDCVPVRLGFAVEIPPSHEAQIRPRSGLSSKRILVQLGIIDSDYRGEVKAIVLNLNDAGFTIHRGDRIAQMAVLQLPPVELEVADGLSETSRGLGGFGSTGVR